MCWSLLCRCYEYEQYDFPPGAGDTCNTYIWNNTTETAIGCERFGNNKKGRRKAKLTRATAQAQAQAQARANRDARFQEQRKRVRKEQGPFQNASIQRANVAVSVILLLPCCVVPIAFCS